MGGVFFCGFTVSFLLGVDDLGIVTLIVNIGVN